MHKKLLGITACGLLLLTTGCVKVPKLENGQEVVASINDKQFTANDLYDKLKENYGAKELVDIIDNHITDLEVTNKDDAKSKAKSYIKEMKDYYEKNNQNWANVLASNGFTEKSLEEYYTYNYAKQTVAENYYKSIVTDEEINKYYENEIIGDITASHILITSDATDSMSEEEKKAKDTEAYNKAKEIIEKLNKGEDFAQLAKDNSKDGSASEGGVLAPFNKQSNYVEEFIDAAMKLEVGKYSTEPVKTKFGYHIILVKEKKDKPSLEDVKQTIIDKVAQNNMDANQNYFNTAWKKVREKYNLKINDTIIDETYNKNMSQY